MVLFTGSASPIDLIMPELALVQGIGYRLPPDSRRQVEELVRWSGIDVTFEDDPARFPPESPIPVLYFVTTPPRGTSYRMLLEPILGNRDNAVVVLVTPDRLARTRRETLARLGVATFLCEGDSGPAVRGLLRLAVVRVQHARLTAV